MQLATYAGWKLHGMRGGLAAGLLFVLPGACVVLALTMLYAGFGKLPLVEALFYGIKAAVLAIVIEALLRVARRALKTRADWVIAGLAFLALFCLRRALPHRHHRGRGLWLLARQRRGGGACRRRCPPGAR